ncbi:Cytoplasmic glyoxalase II, partial [Tulasnella sp. 418]
MKVVPVPVRSDNYAYLLIDDATSEAAAVDIFDVPKVVGKANELGVRITSLLTTHCHLDHGGGNKDFADQFPDVPIYGGSGKVRAVTKIVQEGDILKVGDNITVKCLATPCHTRDSICYYVEDVTRSQRGVFTGDTLFVAGCGKFFEGTAEE